MKKTAPISAFALHIWGNLHQVQRLLTLETWDEYNQHPSNVLVRYLTHRGSMLTKTNFLAELDC